MPLNEAISKVLSTMQGSYSQGLAESNPPPDGGTYAFQLKSVNLREGKSNGQPCGIVTIGFRTVGSETFPDYDFNVQLWSSQPRNMAMLARMAATASGKASIAKIAECYETLLSVVDSAIFSVEVEKVDNKKGGFWTNYNVLGCQRT